MQHESGTSRVVAIVGPTASGKSDLALAVAARVSAEIVTADSMQMYVGMDIGTATPTVAERAAVRHHLVDVWDIDHEASVAEFQVLARAAIDDVASRDALALLVGGSGLYVRAVLDDLTFPGTDPAVRARLEAELIDLGAQQLHERLTALDPAAGEAISANNGRRIVRALEVIEITGQPFTATLPDETPVFADLRVGLQVAPDVLVDRIERRVRRMWDDGLVDEVRDLVGRGLAQTRTASRAIGYSQVLAFLAGEMTESEAMEATVVATRRFAKRQMTWFRRDPRVVWFAHDDPRLVDRVIDLATTTSKSGQISSL